MGKERRAQNRLSGRARIDRCPYCGAKVELKDSAFLYGKSFGYVWVCSRYPQCDAYVGCHSGTTTPLGTMAQAELRAWRKTAHAMLDRVWRSGAMPRRDAYRKYLREGMNLPKGLAHIAMFTEEQCQKLIKILEHDIFV